MKALVPDLELPDTMRVGSAYLVLADTAPGESATVRVSDSSAKVESVDGGAWRVTPTRPGTVDVSVTIVDSTGSSRGYVTEVPVTGRSGAGELSKKAYYSLSQSPSRAREGAQVALTMRVSDTRFAGSDSFSYEGAYTLVVSDNGAHELTGPKKAEPRGDSRYAWRFTPQTTDRMDVFWDAAHGGGRTEIARKTVEVESSTLHRFYGLVSEYGNALSLALSGVLLPLGLWAKRRVQRALRRRRLLKSVDGVTGGDPDEVLMEVSVLAVAESMARETKDPELAACYIEIRDSAKSWLDTRDAAHIDRLRELASVLRSMPPVG